MHFKSSWINSFPLRSFPKPITLAMTAKMIRRGHRQSSCFTWGWVPNHSLHEAEGNAWLCFPRIWDLSHKEDGSIPTCCGYHTRRKLYSLSVSMARLTKVWHCHHLIWCVRDRNGTRASPKMNGSWRPVCQKSGKSHLEGWWLGGQLGTHQSQYQGHPHHKADHHSPCHHHNLELIQGLFLTRIFKSLSTIRRGVLGASEVTKLPEECRSAEVHSEQHHTIPALGLLQHANNTAQLSTRPSFLDGREI